MKNEPEILRKFVMYDRKKTGIPKFWNEKTWYQERQPSISKSFKKNYKSNKNQSNTLKCRLYAFWNNNRLDLWLYPNVHVLAHFLGLPPALECFFAYRRPTNPAIINRTTRHLSALAHAAETARYISEHPEVGRQPVRLEVAETQSEGRVVRENGRTSM